MWLDKYIGKDVINWIIYNDVNWIIYNDVINWII